MSVTFSAKAWRYTLINIKHPFVTFSNSFTNWILFTPATVLSRCNVTGLV